MYPNEFIQTQRFVKVRCVCASTDFRSIQEDVLDCAGGGHSIHAPVPHIHGDPGLPLLLCHCGYEDPDRTRAALPGCYILQRQPHQGIRTVPESRRISGACQRASRFWRGHRNFYRNLAC